MRRSGSALLGTLASVALVAACAAPPPPAGPATDDAEVLMGLERTWAHAVMTHDATPLGGLLADDFTQTSETGEVRNREETIARVGSSAAVFSSGGLEDLRVRLYGDAAVVTGRFTGEGRSGDEAFTVDVRWTDTFVRRDGRWWCVASQSTTIERP
jgi:ketosteroid isomerase-like protein